MISVLATRGDGPALEVPVTELPALLADPGAHVWVDLAGPMDEAAVHVVRDVFRFHPVAVEDCFEARAHPKLELFDGYVYVITHGVRAGSTPEELATIELDIFLGKTFLVTYHASPSRSIAAVADLVRRGGDVLRRGPMTLLHAILARQVDGIEPLLDEIEDRITQTEERVMERPTHRDLATLLALRRNILHLRRWLIKQRDVVLPLVRNELTLGTPADAHLFRDVHDHLVRFVDLLENYRELTTSIQDAYLNVTNNRLNETMKFLTLFTAVLMPLTVITGIYGMNFQHMPELKWPWGYFATLGVMAATAGTVLWFFKRRGLIGRPPEEAPAVEPPPPADPTLS